MKKFFLLTVLVLMVATPFVAASRAVNDDDASDLWFFQLSGPVKSADIESVEHIHVEFDRSGRITYMRYGECPVTVHRNAVGRIDSITYVPVVTPSEAHNSDVVRRKRVDDFSTTKYRQRATDERGNWIARKTQRSPYIITTEYCTTIYY